MESRPGIGLVGDESVEEPAPKRRSRRNILLGAAGLLALALLAFGLHALSYARTHIGTDDAQVEGHITPVLSRVDGYVRGVNVRDNQRVRPGEVLVEIDDRVLRAKLEQAEADLAEAVASSGPRGQAGAEIRAAHALVIEAQANAVKANADQKRARALAAGGLISRRDLEAAETAARGADAQLAAARDRETAAGASSRGANSRVAAARAARDQAALQLSYTRVTTPAAGVVSKKSVEVGQLVQPGQPLMAVVPLEDVWIIANLKETQLRSLSPGEKVEIKADTYPGRVFHGHVESVSPATGSKFSLLPPDNATGNFVKVVQRVPVKIVLDTPNDLARPLRPGMSVRVSILTGS